jgi:putative oxygen-independent coproporphyrinogen III oxidase
METRRHSETKKVAAEPAGLYIHFPFCRSKCPYCHFYSTASLGLVPDWLEAVKKEALLYQGLFPSFDTVYFGGGTPSLLSPVALGELLEFLHNRFHLSENCEITLEANPGDLDREAGRELRKTGLNRLSLGVQSFSEEDLTFLGRRHRVPDAIRAIEAGRSAGFENLGIDLIYGLPGQTSASWQEGLAFALSFEPEHISTYQLTPEEGTPLGNRVARGQVRLWGEAEAARRFLETSRMLEGRGYLHYEVSNFVRGETRMSRHNRKYWRQVPYLGLGPAAHSYLENRRWWNPASVAAYLDRLREGLRPVAGEEALSPDQERMESLLLGFRNREGVAMGQLRLDRESRAVLAYLKTSKKINRLKDRLIPTPRGYLLADRLPLFFC